MPYSAIVSKNVCTHRQKATVTKRRCLKQLNTFSTFQFAVEGVQGQIKSMDMCRMSVPKAWSLVRQHQMLDLQDVNWYKCMILHLKLSDDRSWRRPPGGDNELAIIWLIWWRQVVQHRTASLNSTRCRTGNQCSCCKMWSHLQVPVTKRAAAFCTACKHRSRMSEMPYRREVAVV